MPWSLSPVRGLTVSLLLALAGSTTAPTDRTPGTVADATFARCRDTQVAVAAFQLPGVAVSGGVLVRYRNTSPSACTLSGYPTVVGLVSRTGPSQVAVDVRAGAFGGWEPTSPVAKKPLPTVVLRGRKVASSVVEFVTGIGDLLCYTKRNPLWFRYLSLNLPGGTRPFVLKLSAITMIVCSHFDAGPFVPGTTGSAQ